MQLREVLRLGLIAALALTPAGAARAVELYLETVPTTSGDTCPEPCYQVRMFVEDPTRNFEIQAVQFDIDLESGGTPALLPIPPATNSNAAPGNVNVEGPDENIIVVPWNLSSTVGRSPAMDFDARVVSASDTPFDVKTLAAVFGDRVDCAPAAVCALAELALAAHRIYVGRFNAMLTGPPAFRLGTVFGEGPAVEDPEIGLMRRSGTALVCEGNACRSAAPEPANLILVAAALAVLGAARRH